MENVIIYFFNLVDKLAADSPGASKTHVYADQADWL
jgi:hypothetical protein